VSVAHRFPVLPTPPLPCRLFFSYHELVRKNYVKDYSGGIVQAELEEHLSDPEFSVRFNMTKASPPFLPHPLTPPQEQFRALPKWRRTERKKNLMLF
jgi:hypothetical protein